MSAPKNEDATDQVISFFSRGWSSFTNTIKTVVEEPKLQEVLQKVKEQVDVIAKPEDDEDARKKRSLLIYEKLATVLAPWEDFGDENDDQIDKVAKIEAKSNIIAIATQRRNLLNGPPEIEGFEFDYEAWLPVAMVALEKDPELSKARFELVPKKISEKEFWKNYFTRVYMIKQAYKFKMSQPPKLDEPTPVQSNQTESEKVEPAPAAAVPAASAGPLGDSLLKSEATDTITSGTPEFASEFYELESDPSIEELKMSLPEGLSAGEHSDETIVGADTTGTSADADADELELGEPLSLEDELRQELEQDL